MPLRIFHMKLLFSWGDFDTRVFNKDRILFLNTVQVAGREMEMWLTPQTPVLIEPHP